MADWIDRAAGRIVDSIAKGVVSNPLNEIEVALLSFDLFMPVAAIIREEYEKKGEHYDNN